MNIANASILAANKMKVKLWEHFGHEADMGVRGFGATKQQAFENAAFALIAVIADPGRVRPEELVELNCEAADDKLLFVDWLNALVYEMATRKMLFSRFEVSVDGHKLHGKAWGESVRHHRPLKSRSDVDNALGRASFQFCPEKLAKRCRLRPFSQNMRAFTHLQRAPSR